MCPANGGPSHRIPTRGFRLNREARALIVGGDTDVQGCKLGQNSATSAPQITARHLPKKRPDIEEYANL
mgnify:FL=1